MDERIRGGCHCGAVRYEAEGDSEFGAHCQCTDCRKFSGSGHKSFMKMPADGMTVTGQVAGYDYGTSSGAVLTPQFCPICGAGIYSKHTGSKTAVFLYASALDDPERFTPQMVTFTRSGPSWDHLDPELAAYEEGFRQS